jgi:glycosyltransferase involved in cell wall biosynthesis
MKISIVMPSFNQGRFVEAALHSIFEQNYADWEILFIDGGSTDGTMDIVERYKDRIAYCLSETDAGQSDALRKGFAQASGDVLTWLNTDDLLLPGALSEVAEVFSLKPHLSWLLGNVVWIDQETKIVRCWRGEGYTFGWTRIGLLTAGGPSAFFKRDLYDRVGGVNVLLHYQMDTELWWRFALAGEKFHRLSGYTWALRLHEGAKTSGYMFSDQSSEKQRKIASVQIAEKQHIEGLINPHLIRFPKLISRGLHLVRRGLSINHLYSRFQTIRFFGKDISNLVKKK